MENSTTSVNSTLENYGIKNAITHWNLSSETLTKITLEKGLGKLADNGALAINTGEFTGRSPKDRFFVKDNIIL